MARRCPRQEAAQRRPRGRLRLLPEPEGHACTRSGWVCAAFLGWYPRCSPQSWHLLTTGSSHRAVASAGVGAGTGRAAVGHSGPQGQFSDEIRSEESCNGPCLWLCPTCLDHKAKA